LNSLEFKTTFHRLSVDGFEGDATRVGLKILIPQKLEWLGHTWAITDVQRLNITGTEITVARLSRSRNAELLHLTESGSELRLTPHRALTNEFIPIAFFHKAHVFAIPARPRFSPRAVTKVLRAFAGTALTRISFYPLLREQSLRSRLRDYVKILELSFSAVRANPESRADAKLFTDELEKSHVQRQLLKLVGDPRGINIDSQIVESQLAYVEDGLGELNSGKAINAAGLEEPISGKNVTPLSITIHSNGEPADFGKKLAENSPISTKNIPQLPLRDE